MIPLPDYRTFGDAEPLQAPTCPPVKYTSFFMVHLKRIFGYLQMLDWSARRGRGTLLSNALVLLDCVKYVSWATVRFFMLGGFLCKTCKVQIV